MDPIRPPVLGIAHIALYVHDMERALQYYKSYLGFDEAFEADNIGDRPGARWIKINDHQFVELIPEVVPGSDRLYKIALETDDAKGLREYLAAKGIPISERTALNRDGDLGFVIHDPDGHPVEFVQYLPGNRTARDFGLHLPKTRMSQRISHCGFLVRHFEASRRFYHEVLGCYETWRGSRDNKFVSFVNMQMPDSPDYLEFMLYETMPASEIVKSRNHFSFPVADIYETQKLLAGRPPTAGAPPPSDVIFAANNRRLINYFDADGTRVEVMEAKMMTDEAPQSTTLPVP